MAQDRVKSIKLEGVALAKAKDAAEVWRNFYQAKDKLEKEFQSNMQALYDRATGTAKQLMGELYALAGLPPEAKWNLDARYAHGHDLALLVAPDHDEDEQIAGEQATVN